MTNEQHLDDIALCGLIDGESDGRAHADACAGCTARLGELAGARTALRDAPVGLDELTRTRMIRAALDAGDRARPGEPRRSRWIPALAAVSSLAAAVILVIAVGSGGARSHNTAAKLPAQSAARNAGSLGDVSDPQALKAALLRSDTGESVDAQALTTGGSGSAGAVAGATGEPSADASAGTNSGAPESFPSAAAAQSSRVAPKSTPTANGPASEQYRVQTPPLDDATAARCAATIIRAHRPGRFSLWASATYRGQTVLVEEFVKSTSGKLRHKAFVVDPSTCDVLTFAAFDH